MLQFVVETMLPNGSWCEAFRFALLSTANLHAERLETASSHPVRIRAERAGRTVVTGSARAAGWASAR